LTCRPLKPAPDFPFAHIFLLNLESAPDEDAKTEILSYEYEQFYAELYKNYEEVRELHK
jgi:hypothetical protein